MCMFNLDVYLKEYINKYEFHLELTLQEHIYVYN